MKRKEWKNIEGVFTTTIHVEEDTFRDLWLDGNDQTFPKIVQDELEALFLVHRDISTEAEVEINFLSSGYHLPASQYGGADHMGWAEEGDDQRVLNGRISVTYGDDCVELSKRASELMFAQFSKEIQEVEITGE